jgi:hypothetical protein
MSLDFRNATLLSYSSENQFFGENVFRYRTIKNIEVEGLLLDLTRQSGVSGIISGINAVEQQANDWQSFVINGVNFGSGTIDSLSFDTSNGVRQDGYRISLKVFDTGNALNLPTTGVYQGISYSNYQFVENLSETISLDRDFEKDVYNHSLDIKLSSSNKNESIRLAKGIAKNLFENCQILNCLGSYYNISGKKATYEEVYDQLNSDCSFNKKIEFFANSSGNYTVNKNYSYNRDEKGITTVSENGNIIALTENYLNVLSAAYQTEFSSSYANCLDVFNAYKEPDTYSLDSSPITKGSSLNRFERILDYEVVFTNNLRDNNGYFWDYTHESNLSENGLIVTTEQGTIVGRGHRVEDKYNNALNGFDIVDNAITSRSNAAYDRFKNIITLPNSSWFILTNKSNSYQKHNGVITYSWQYSNDQTLVTDQNIVQSIISLEEGFEVPISQAFNIFNYKEIEQVSSNYEVATKTLTINLRGRRTTTMEQYLAYAKTLALSYASGTEYINNVNYSLSPFDNQFSFTIEWIKIFEP